MRINPYDRETLKLILEQLDLIDASELRALRQTKRFITRLINLGNETDLNFLNSLDSAGLTQCIDENIRQPLLEIYNSKLGQNNSSLTDIIFSILIASTTYWPLNDETTENNDNPWYIPNAICPISGNDITLSNALILLSGHLCDKKAYLETRTKTNNLLLLSHPILPGLINANEYSYNFTLDINSTNFSKNILNFKSGLRAKFPIFNYYKLLDIAKYSSLPTLALLIATIIPNMWILSASATILLSVLAPPLICGIAFGILGGLILNKISDNLADQEYEDAMKAYDQQNNNDRNLVNNFANKIYDARKAKFDELSRTINSALSSLANIFRLLQIPVQNNAASNQASLNSNIRLSHSENTRATNRTAYSELTDFTLSVVDPSHPGQPLSEETIQMNIPRFRNSR
ncbi:MAG: hypothetical protein V4501_03025 [Pseudomonadota bacterium]